MLRSSGPLTEIKLMPDSFAIAWTTRKIRTVEDGKSKDYIFRHRFKIISHNWWFVFFYNHSAGNWFQSVCLYLSVSVCLPVYVSLSVHMRVCPTVSSVCLFVSVYPSICLCLFVRLCLCICRSFWPFSETDEGREIVVKKQAKKADGRRNIKLRSQRGIQRNDTAWLFYLNYSGLIISPSFCVPLLEEFFHSLVVQPVESPGVEWDRALGILLDISLEPDRMGSQ